MYEFFAIILFIVYLSLNLLWIVSRTRYEDIDGGTKLNHLSLINYLLGIGIKVFEANSERRLFSLDFNFKHHG